MDQRDKVLRANLILWEGKLGVDIVFASGYRVALPMTEETVSAETLLAAERERCAKVADTMGAECRTSADSARPGLARALVLCQAAQASDIAAAIRSLASQTIGGE